MATDAALADLRAALQQEHANLRQQLAGMSDGDDGLMAFDQNFADSSQVTAERSEVEVLVKSIKENLEEVEAALAKFDTGTFGTCENCDRPIGADRLEAKPAARLCMDCASRR